jgi:hypothetical protein
VEDLVSVTDEEPAVPGVLGPQVPELGAGGGLCTPHAFTCMPAVYSAAQGPGQEIRPVRAAIIEDHDFVGELLTPTEDTVEVLVSLIADQQCGH